jgi:hypothetical protein
VQDLDFISTGAAFVHIASITHVGPGSADRCLGLVAVSAQLRRILFWLRKGWHNVDSLNFPGMALQSRVIFLGSVVIIAPWQITTASLQTMVPPLGGSEICKLW